jgi:transcriptional regulator with XRE-family HTH domain
MSKTCYGGSGARMMDGFAGRLKRLRVRRGYSQCELAERAGLTQGALSHLEQGRRNPTMQTIYRLADALDLPPGDLLNWDDWAPRRGQR